MNKALIILTIIAIACLAFVYDWVYVPERDTFSYADTHYGCYWGDVGQKKAGTPENWKLVRAGTQSAQWCSPEKLALIAKSLKKECPDEEIINRMPTTDGSIANSSYYIKGGKRMEISEYDAAWVGQNCQVPVQEVF